MKTSSHMLLRLALPLLVVVVIAAHGGVLYYIGSHMALPATVIAGIIVLVIVKHLGLLAPLVGWVRKRARR
jgi:hypothetical protein